MSLKVLSSIRLAQVEPEEPLSQSQLWQQQQIEEDAAAEEAAKRFRYQRKQTAPSHRGLKLTYKPEAGGPGEFSHMSFPLVEVGEVLGDPTKTGLSFTQAEAGPSIGKGPETQHQIEAAEQLRQMGIEPTIIGDEEIPSGYEFIIPDPVEFLLDSKTAGKQGWLARLYNYENTLPDEEKGRFFAFPHPSLLPARAGFTREEQEAFSQSTTGSPDMKKQQAYRARQTVGLFFMNMINNYLSAGDYLRNHPEENDQEYILNNFWVKQLSMKDQRGNPLFIDRNNPLNPQTIYGYLYNSFGKQAIKQLENELGFTSDEDLKADAINYAINNIIRKILSGYFNKDAEENARENPAVKGAYLVGYIKDSIKYDILSFLDKKRNKKEKFSTDINFQGLEDSDERGLEDTIADTNVDVEQEVIDAIQAYEDSLSENTERGLDADINIRNKQNIARTKVLGQIEVLAPRLGVQNILAQWNNEFKEFLVNHKTYMPEDIVKVLPELLPVIDFRAGILPQNSYPCLSCGNTFIDQNGKMEPAVVKESKTSAMYHCRICNFRTSRPDDLANSLTIPLLAFLEAKKLQYLKDKSLDLEQRVNFAEEVDLLMSTCHVKTSLTGPGRSTRSVAGKQPILLYKNGKLFMQHARGKQSPEMDRLLRFVELNEIPLSSLFAGSGYPVGGFNVGYDRRGEAFRPPFGEAALGLTPTVPYERNTILQTMISAELLPIIVRDPKVQKMFGGLKPVELLSSSNIKSNMRDTLLVPLMKEALSALQNIKLRVDVTLQPGQQVESYSQLLETANPDLIKETVYQLSRKYDIVIPGDNSPAPPDEMMHLLERSAYVLDTIASLNDEDINNLSMDQLLNEDPAARENVWYPTAANYNQFLPSDKIKNKPGDISDISGDFGSRQEALQSNEAGIEKVMNFIRSRQGELEKLGLSLPRDAKDTAAISALASFLIDNGIEEMGVDKNTISTALARIGIMYQNTQRIYELFNSGEIPSEDKMVDLSEILSDKSSKAIMQALVDRNGKSMPAAFATIEGSPLVKMLYYMSHGDAAFSITDFLQILLVSASGMFGVAEDYEVGPEYMATDESGEPIRFAPPTADAETASLKKQQSFDASFREQVQGTQEFPIGHPRMVEMSLRGDPYGQSSKAGKYRLFADKFSVNAIAQNPRYKYYLDELVKQPQFQGMTSEEIITELRNETTDIVKTLYMDQNSELFKNDPITSMRAIASFFVPSDLIDACSDAWARNVQNATPEMRQSGAIQNSFYQASTILFDIYDAINNQDVLSGDKAIINDVIYKYQLADMDSLDDSEWVAYLQTLFTKIINDIREGKGCATRALSVIADRDNLKYLSTLYDPRTRYKQIAEAKILRGVNSLIRLASKNANKEMLDDLNILQSLINEELYEEV